jgi:hypothetical protein
MRNSIRRECDFAEELSARTRWTLPMAFNDHRTAGVSTSAKSASSVDIFDLSKNGMDPQRTQITQKKSEAFQADTATIA